MLNKPMLQSVMALHRDTQSTLARTLGISASRINAKINEAGGAAFTLHEMQAIKERYQLSADAVCKIFFASVVSQKEESEVAPSECIC